MHDFADLFNEDIHFVSTLCKRMNATQNKEETARIQTRGFRVSGVGWKTSRLLPT
jgi:hypothetical protein